jgi:hypothetical protein
LRSFLKKGIDPIAHFDFFNLIGMPTIGQTIQLAFFLMVNPNQVKGFLCRFNKKEYLVISAVIGFAAGENQTMGTVRKNDDSFRRDLNIGFRFNDFGVLTSHLQVLAIKNFFYPRLSPLAVNTLFEAIFIK